MHKADLAFLEKVLSRVLPGSSTGLSWFIGGNNIPCMVLLAELWTQGPTVWLLWALDFSLI